MNATAKALSSDVDYHLSYLRQYYISLFSSDGLSSLQEYMEPPFLHLIDVVAEQNLLSGDASITNDVQSYYYINVASRWVVSNYGILPYEKIVNREDLEELVSRLALAGKPFSWIDTTESIAENNAYYALDLSGKFLALVRYNTLGLLPVSVLLVQLKDSFFYDMTHAASFLGYDVALHSGDVTLCMTSPDGNALFGASGLVKNGRTEYLVSSFPSLQNDLTYTFWQDMTQVRHGAMAYLLAAVFIIVACALVFLLVGAIHRLYTQPMERMRKDLAEHEKKNEHDFFVRLLTSELNENDYEEGMKKWNVPMGKSYAYVFAKAKEDSGYDFSAITIPSVTMVCPLMMINKKASTVLVADSEEAMDSIIVRFLSGLEELSGHRIAVGCSSIFTDLHDCRLARNEAGQALQSRDSGDLSRSTFHLFDDFLQTGYTRTIADSTLEEQFSSCIKDGKEKEAEHILDLILDRMEVRGLVGSDRSFYTGKIIDLVLSAMLAGHVTVGEVFSPEAYDSLMAMKETLYDNQSLKTFLMSEVVTPAVTRIREKEASGDSRIVQSILSILAHRQGNVTLGECADMLSCHPSTISKALRTEKGKSYLDLATEIKINAAKYYLLSTDLPISAIAENLGYTNEQNFSRFFRSKVGKTPGEYRKLSASETRK